MGARSVAFLLALVLAAATPHSQARAGQNSEQVPHWVELPLPWTMNWSEAPIIVPPGFRLCGIGSSYSSHEPVFVPLDRGLRCEDMGPFDSPDMPDSVEISVLPNFAMNFETTADIVKVEGFYCHGRGHEHSRWVASKSRTVIAPAGSILAGLKTVTCTRMSESGRYTKAYVAYWPRPDADGRGYTFAVSAHAQNRREADALLEKIVRSFKLPK